MSDWSFVTAAYGLTWAVLIAYGLVLSRRARRAGTAFGSGAAAGGAP
jgi:hypothetical protein